MADDNETQDDSQIEEVETSMSEGEEDEDETRQRPVVKSDDTYYGTGRRKEAVARVWIEEGNGTITINDTPVDQFFNNRQKWINATKAPLESVGFSEDIDVWATTEGGGLTGQADAVKLGVARALVNMDQNAKSWLRPDGHLTRDDREVERKKINQPGARAKQQVSKR
jgi:small subunit ribosomal protein S9